MSVPLRRAGLLLALPLLLTASAALADVTRFDNLLHLVRAEPDPTVVLEKCGATVFTLNADQRAQLTKAGATASLIDALQKKRMSLDDVQNFALVVDCSGSMKEKLPDGRTKMDAAKAVLTELVQKIPDGLNVSLTLYGHDVAAGCQAVEVKRSLSQINSAERQALTEILAGLEPVGYTPIAAALRAAGGTLEGAKGLSQVVLVTDGMETCHEDPAAVAEAVTLKYQLRGVQVVGLGIKVEEKSAVKRIAIVGRGKFYDTQTAQEIAPAIKAVVLGSEEEQGVLPPRVKALIEALQDKDSTVRAEAAKNLGNQGAKAKGAVPALIKALVEALQDEDWVVRLQAANSLGKMGAKANEAVPALVKRVADERYGMEYSSLAYNHGGNGLDKHAALAALMALAPEQVEQALLDATKAKNSNVKRWASDRLAELDGGAPPKPNPETNDAGTEVLPPRVKVLVDQLQDEDWEIRAGAAVNLGKMGAKAKGAVPALVKRVADERYGMEYSSLAYNHGSNGLDKHAALAALKALAPPEQVEQALLDATKAKNPNVKRWAGDRLGELE